jgi:hypothetical protein
MNVKIIEDKDVFFESGRIPAVPWFDCNPWPAKWISCYDKIEMPFMAAYRKKFDIAGPQTVRIHVSADERYILYLDGEFVGRGSERSDLEHWCYETYELSLDKGIHTISAKVWSLGDELSPGAQMSCRHGFILATDGDLDLSTGTTPWQAKEIKGISYGEISDFSDRATGVRNVIDFSLFDETVELGGGDAWCDAVAGTFGECTAGMGHMSQTPYLTPALLPAMMYDEVRVGCVKVVNQVSLPQIASEANSDCQLVTKFQKLFTNNEPVTILPETSMWVLVDLENYYCAYTELSLKGNGTISVDFSESLGISSTPDYTCLKENRGEYDGKFWTEFKGDTFVVNDDSSRCATPIWFRTGRWLALKIESGNRPLTISSLKLLETRYPLEQNSAFDCSDASFKSIEPIMLRALQMCAHEAYFDCPYHEQLMYLGDTRLQALVTYAINGDTRLPKKALKLFDWSRNGTGLTTSCYPNVGTQKIPPFSLVWIGMLYDYMMWAKGSEATVKESIPCMRSIVEYWESFRQNDNLMISPPGWNFVDWSRPEGIGGFINELPRWGEFDYNGIKGVKWDIGTPPDGYSGGISGVLNLFYLYFLGFAVDVEKQFGAPEMANRYTRLRKESFEAIHGAFYSEENAMYADNIDKSIFSEHSQCLALLSEMPCQEIQNTVSDSLFNPKRMLAETTYYFSHYYFETCRITGRIDKMLERQQRWQLFADLDLKTTLEEPEPSRSDCHAWGAHPLFHWYTTILGIRPTEPSLNKFVIKPQLGELEYVKGKMPVDDGFIEVDVENNGKMYTGKVSVSPNIRATVEINGQIMEINNQGYLEF